MFFFSSIYIGRYKENYDILEEIIAKTWLVPCFFEGSVFFCESNVIRSQSFFSDGRFNGEEDQLVDILGDPILPQVSPGTKLP